MIAEYNKGDPIVVIAELNWTIDTFTAFVDSLPEGEHLIYLTGSATNTLTGRGYHWGFCKVYRRTLVYDLAVCEIHTYNEAVPICVMSKTAQDGWAEGFVPRASS